MTNLTTPVGRLVRGHPMRAYPMTDDNNQPINGSDGVQLRDTYIGLAIPKGQEQQWQQTPWGQIIYNEGVAGWPQGEHGAPTFAWKITNGDDPVPDKNGVPPNTREGYPGHWIVNMSSLFGIACFHTGRFDPTQQIHNENEIKCGDYCRVILDVVPNNLRKIPKSPGVYINPQKFELFRAGIAIVTANSGPSAAEGFAQPAALPAGALVDTAVAAPVVQQPPAYGQPVQPAQVVTHAPPPPQTTVQPPAAPATGFLTPPPAPQIQAAPPEPSYNVNGQVHTRSVLVNAGYTDAHFAGMVPLPAV